MSFVPLPSPSTLSPSSLARHPLFVLLRLVAIALLVAVAIAIALAAVIIALFDAHRRAPSPPTAICIRSDGGIGGSLAPAAAAKVVGRGRQRRSGSVSAATVLSLWRR
jgi:hypothetical protein